MKRECRRYTKLFRERLLPKLWEMLDRGVQITVAADRLDVPQSTLRHWSEEAGRDVRRYGRWSPRVKARALQALREGESAKRVAKRLHLDLVRVKALRDQYAIPRLWTPQPADVREAAIAAYLAGEGSCVTVAKRFGVSDSCVRKWLRKRGIPRRPPWAYRCEREQHPWYRAERAGYLQRQGAGV